MGIDLIPLFTRAPFISCGIEYVKYEIRYLGVEFGFQRLSSGGPAVGRCDLSFLPLDLSRTPTFAWR